MRGAAMGRDRVVLCVHNACMLREGGKGGRCENACRNACVAFMWKQNAELAPCSPTCPSRLTLVPAATEHLCCFSAFHAC